MRRPLLFERFPRLRGELSWLELGSFPTPVEPLHQLGSELGCSRLFVKRDDLSSPTYGGNKVRKLEFVLGHALSRSSKTIVTVGAAGSNHVLATAIHGADHGLRTIGLLVPQPTHPYVRKNLLAGWAVGCRLEPVAGSVEAIRRFGRLWLEVTRRERRRPYVLWAGGSTTRGVLGYVEAALEIAEQVRAGQLPEPASIFVPLGSAGTLAGLVLGCRLAGLRSEPVGVRVYDRTMANEWAVAWLARRAWSLLRELDGSVPDVTLSAQSIRVLHGYCGRGYAHGTASGTVAIARIRALEGLELEPTYSGKAMAAFIDYASSAVRRAQPALFIHTYSSANLEPLVARCPGPEVLPSPLRGYFADYEGG
ncbi:MAG: pyridoxal-phosphate dependent enzyme [Deltaproteobacteria bacterium]|jgi:D-cysteine desulfhydrase|nr:pyridoxal-phosphate dependent enzyme [Deltaproteobacteria bacterium]MBW2536678.1 pyridoxal-phosphate dependent enzyme [Deltaproteobacteria bacterium]